MKVEIIGLGAVGMAQAYLSHKLGHEVCAYDVQPKDVPSYIHVGPSVRRDVAISFVCTPEAVVEEVVGNLKENRVKGLYVIKSTTPVGTTKELMRRHEIHLCHNPEFLRQKHAFNDVLNPSRIVIGECCREHGTFLEGFYRPLSKSIYRVDPTTSELVKLVSNSLRSINISFWNEIALLCKQMDVNVDELAQLANPAKVLDEWEGGRWGTRFFGEPYGGKCLPKDTRHLIEAFRKADLNPGILEAAQRFNDWLKTKMCSLEREVI